MKTQYLAPAIAAAVLSAGVASAQTSQVSPQGQAFLTYAVQDSIGEIDACKMAQQKSTNANVKSFCDRMISDHSKMISQATQLGQKLGVTVPEKPSDEAVIEKAALQQKTGSAFDQEFMKAQVQDHQNDINTTRDAIDAAQDPQVKSLAQQTLATLQTHLQLSQQTLAKV